MKVIKVAIVIWVNARREIYLQPRNEKGPLNGFLEFPGGKIEKNESALNTAEREFSEETDFSLSDDAIFTFLKNYTFSYPDRKVTLHVYTLKDSASENQSTQWYPLEYSSKILEANKVIINDLKASLA